MADLDVRVRLTGESGQLVGQLKGVAGAEKEVAAAADQITAAAGKATNATLGQGRAAEQTAIKAAQLAAAEDRAALAALRLAQAQERAKRATEGVGRSTQATGAGLQGLGVQFGDFTTQVSLGSNVFQAFGAQAGQAAFAMQSMGGVAGRVGTFLAGPWGSLILAAVTVVGVLGTKLLGASDAAEELELSSYAVKDAQGILGNVMDLTTGKINTQIPAVLALARAQILLARVQAQTNLADAKRGVTALQDRPVELTGGFGGGFSMQRREEDARDVISRQVLTGQLGGEEAVKRLDNLRRVGRLTTEEFTAAATAVANFGLEAENLKVFDASERLLNGAGTGADRGLLLKPGRSAKPKSAGDGAAEAERLAKFGNQAAESIQRITEQFDSQPKLVDRVNAATRQLDAIVEGLNKKQPKGFRDMIAEAERAKGVVQDALVQPFRDYVEAQQRSRAIQSLVVAGRQDEAEALQVIYGLQDRVGTVTEAQRKTILATVAAEREQNELLARRNELAGAYTASIQDARSAVEGLLSGQLTGKDFLKNLQASFRQLQGKVLTEQLLGPLFRDLEKTVQERTGIQSSVDIFKAGTESAGKAGGTMASALEKAAGRVAGLFGGGDQVPAAISRTPISGTVRDDLGMDFDALVEGLANPIVVEARKISSGALALTPGEFSGMLSNVLTQPIVDQLGQLLGPRFAAMLQGVLGGALAGFMRAGPVGAVLGGAQKLFGDLTSSGGIKEGLGAAISSGLGKALKGAETGTAVAGIGKSLGLKMSTTGAQIGGAIGSAIPIPGGELIGSVLGGLVGGLFKKAKTGSATITGGSGDPTLSGNNAAFKKAAGGLGDSVQQGLNSIADQLGAELGSFAVSIGIRDGKYRVDPTGSGKTKKSAGALDFGKDGAEEAVAAAIANAIKDGALLGLSAAQQRAVQSTTDPTKGLAEALKVRDLEKALGGFSGSALDAFQQFERQAKDRLRIATSYGLQLNKVEELNARERIKLREQLEAQSFGSLQDLLVRLRGGDLFEGSAVDQRNVLLGQIEKAKASAAAGEEGAADKLAQLLEQLNTVSKEVFGTSAGFAGDRSQIENTAESVISLLRQKLDDAAGQVANPQLETTNTLLDEANGQSAQMVAILQAIRDGQPTLAATGTAGVNLGSLAALASTQTFRFDSILSPDR